LVAAYNQLFELVEERRERGLDPALQEVDLTRIHLRLVQCQEKCKRFGV
jgi:hypothetical protein